MLDSRAAVAFFMGDLDGDGNVDIVVADLGTLYAIHGNGDGTFGTPVSLGSASVRDVAVADLDADGRVDLVLQGQYGVAVQLNKGDGTFGAAVGYTLPLGAGTGGGTSVAVRDVNGDGHPDIVVTNDNTDSLNVLLNHGDGTFAAAISSAVWSSPGAAVIGDVDGDGDADVVVRDATGVGVLLGNGSGVFTKGAHYAVGTGTALLMSDFDGDGRPDLAVPAGNDIRVMLNGGNGTFAAPVVYPAPPVGVSRATLGDVDGDGHADVVGIGAYGHVVVLRGNGDGTFAPAVDHIAGDVGNGVAVGDVNGDGHADIAVGAGLLINNGDGTFRGIADYPVGGSTPAGVLPELPVGGTPTAMVVGDFDGDQELDIAVTSSNGTLSVLLGLGGGAFAFTADQTVPAPGRSMAAADLNGDGKLDLVFTTSTDVRVLAGNGDGTFAPAVGYPAGPGPDAVAVGDLNGDGKPDLVVGGAVLNLPFPSWAGSMSVTVLFNNGNGTFGAPVTQPLWSASGSGAVPTVVPGLAIADLDGDGKLDVAVAISPKNAVSVLRNLGNGAFAAPAEYAAGTSPEAVLAVDMNGDGKPDLVTSPGGVLLNDGTGAFAPASTGGAYRSVSVADVNGDGKLDIVGGGSSIVVDRRWGNGVSDQIVYPASVNAFSVVADVNGDARPDIIVALPSQKAVSVWLNTGNGYPARVNKSWGALVASGDLNGDGKPDVAVTNPNSNTASVLLNEGDGTFAAPVDYPVGDYPLSVAIGDLDGDGDLDIAVTNQRDDALSVLLNHGDGTFAPAIQSAVGSGFLAMGDLDGDGKLDVALADFEGDHLRVLFGAGDGTFTGGVTYEVGAYPDAVAIGDLDGDGDLDIAVGNAGTGTVSVLRNLGNGTFASAVDYPAGPAPGSIAIGDLDGDGDLDIAVGNAFSGTHEVDVLWNQGNGAFGPASVHTLPSAKGTSTVDAVAIADLNGDSYPDLVTSGMRVWLGGAGGSLAPAHRYMVMDRHASITPADFDGDGRIDLAVGRTFNMYSVNVMLNRGCP